MHKLMIAAAALTLAVSTLPAAAAKAAKSPYCGMAPAANQSWAEYYGCWGAPGRDHGAPAPSQVSYRGSDTTDYCKLAPAANASWAEHYGCWKPHR
jgi:hypothetical protein